MEDLHATNAAFPAKDYALTVQRMRQQGQCFVCRVITALTATAITSSTKTPIAAHLADHQLTGYVRGIVARDDSDPERTKPSPYRVSEAVRMLDADNADGTLIGNSTSDVMAGHLAGVAVIGYANKPGKAQALASVQAAASTEDLSSITEALRKHPVI